MSIDPSELQGEKGATGDKGDKGVRGERGESGANTPEFVALVSTMTTLAAALTEHSVAMNNLSENFRDNAVATLKKVGVALRLNKISSVIGILVLSGIIFLGIVVWQVHHTQKVNSATLSTDSDILQIVKNDSIVIANVTNPNSKFSQASSKSFETFLNQENVCLANHGDRARAMVSHKIVPPLVTYCSPNGSVNAG